MADATHIEWTDATWNIVTGCSVVSPGCTNCYAMKLAGTRLQHHPSRAGLTTMSKAGPVWNGQVRFNAEWLTQPLRWTKPRMIFVAAHGDLFHDGVTDDQLDQIFAVMALCPQHTFQVLTKRPERMRAYFLGEPSREQEIGQAIIEAGRDHGIVDPLWNFALPLPNVWLGVSVEDQVRADERIPVLLDTPAAVRWISAEPLLGPVDLEPWLSWKGDYLPGPDDRCWGCGSCDTDCPTCPRQKAVFTYPEGPADTDGVPEWIAEHRMTLDWVVAGGESGPGARPMHPDWARQLRDQCAAAGVPFLFKQWGAWTPGVNACRGVTRTEQTATWFNDTWDYGQLTPRESQELHVNDEPDLFLLGKKAAGRLLDGVLHDSFPEVRS